MRLFIRIRMLEIIEIDYATGYSVNEYKQFRSVTELNSMKIV